MDVMKRAIELGVSLLDADNDGNLPIHMASYTKEGLGLPNASAHLKGLKYLIQHNSPVNAKNKLNESPLFIALRFGLKKFVIRLIRAGATLADSKLKFLPYEKVTLLGDPQIILKTPNPIETMLKLRTLFSKCAQRDESHRTDYLSLSKKMESLAVEMMDKANWSSSDITDELFAYGTETEQKLVSRSACREPYTPLSNLSTCTTHTNVYELGLMNMKSIALTPFFTKFDAGLQQAIIHSICKHCIAFTL